MAVLTLSCLDQVGSLLKKESLLESISEEDHLLLQLCTECMRAMRNACARNPRNQAFFTQWDFSVFCLPCYFFICMEWLQMTIIFSTVVYYLMQEDRFANICEECISCCCGIVKNYESPRGGSGKGRYEFAIWSHSEFFAAHSISAIKIRHCLIMPLFLMNLLPSLSSPSLEMRVAVSWECCHVKWRSCSTNLVSL